MAYESFYEGTPYTLEPIYRAKASYGDTFIGHHVPFKRIGAPTSVQTANQIQEVTNLLNQGMRHIEVQAINPEIFDTIPKQHFKEIARVQKLAGAETSIHAPIIEPSGIGKEGWSESDRVEAEHQLNDVIDKAQALNPNGFMPIVIHASAIQGSEESPVSDKLRKEYIDSYKKNHGGEEPEKELVEGLKYKRIVAINQDTKQMIPIEREEKIYPGMQQPKIYTPEEQLVIVNHSQWDNKLSQLVFYKDRGQDVFEKSYPIVAPELAQFLSEKISKEELKRRLDANPQKKAAYNQVQNAMVYLENTDMELNSLFNSAWFYSNKGDREKLNTLSKDYEEKMKDFHQRGGVMDIGMKSEIQQDLIEALRTLKPQVFVPIEKFTKDKSSETFANVAWHAYNGNKKNPPIIAIENLFPGMAFSRSEDLKNLIEETRRKFEDNAVKNGYARDEAKKIGEKMIGATWDVGHLNMQRKSGFQEKDLIAESKNIAPYVKHVHLTDNFGYTDSHLPPGMGNVPIKGILQELEKKGFAGKEVVEAGNFAAQFKISPMPATLEAVGSPIYAMGQAPYWNQMPAIAHGDYFSGYGPIFPDQHFSMYGAGFSGLPTELGGQIQGKQSRFSGTPNE